MKPLLWAAAIAAVWGVAPATAGDIVYKPIDTNQLVVKPTKAAANLAAQTIELIGATTANSVENNGYVKTINNLFSKKVVVPRTQPGPSPLPTPNLFPSTRYKNYNTPLPPVLAPAPRP